MIPEAILTALVLGWILHGKFMRLADVRIKYVWMIFVPVGLGAAASAANYAHVFPTGSWVFGLAQLVGFAAIMVVAVANRRIPGVYLVFAGVALNVIAMVPNGGLMPTAREAMVSIGAGDSVEQMGTAVRHELIGPNTHLRFLCDVIAAKWPFVLWPSVYSIGDVILSLGGLIAIVAIMCNPRYSKQPVMKEA